jgi:hypothetical protein
MSRTALLICHVGVAINQGTKIKLLLAAAAAFIQLTALLVRSKQFIVGSEAESVGTSQLQFTQYINSPLVQFQQTVSTDISLRQVIRCVRFIACFD